MSRAAQRQRQQRGRERQHHERNAGSQVARPSRDRDDVAGGRGPTSLAGPPRRRVWRAPNVVPVGVVEMPGSTLGLGRAARSLRAARDARCARTRVRAHRALDAHRDPQRARAAGSTNPAGCGRASAMRLTDRPSTVTGASVALRIPSSVWRISGRGDADQASAMPSRRFHRTRRTRPFIGVEVGEFSTRRQ